MGDIPEILRLLKERDTPFRSLDGENGFLISQKNAFFTAAILEAQAMEKSVPITDLPYMWRSLLKFDATGVRDDFSYNSSTRQLRVYVEVYF